MAKLRPVPSQQRRPKKPLTPLEELGWIEFKTGTGPTWLFDPREIVGLKSEGMGVCREVVMRGGGTLKIDSARSAETIMRKILESKGQR